MMMAMIVNNQRTVAKKLVVLILAIKTLIEEKEIVWACREMGRPFLFDKLHQGWKIPGIKFQ